MDLNRAAEALARAVEFVPGLRCKPYPDDTVNPPEAQVFTREWDPRMVFGDDARVYAFGVRVMVRRDDPRHAIFRLRQYMEPSGASSVREKIEDTDSWDETVHYAEVTSIGQPFELDLPEGSFLAVDFDVDLTY